MIEKVLKLAALIYRMTFIYSFESHACFVLPYLCLNTCLERILRRRRRKKLIVNNTDDGTGERSHEVNYGVECQHANIAPHNGAEGGLLCHIRDTSGESF